MPLLRSRSLSRAALVFAVFAVLSAPAGALLERWWNWTLGGQQTRLIDVPVAAPVGTTACPACDPARS
jgi:hypothetical protein